MHHSNASPGDFAAYLQSMVQLNALESMTQSLDEQLADSQRIMQEIKGILDSVPTTTQNINGESGNSGLTHEDISKFLEADVPNILLPDMVKNTLNTDEIYLDDVIAQMKHYVEDLKKSIVINDQHPRVYNQTMANLDLDKYAASLDKLNKRLVNIKINKKIDANNKNPEVEAKLELLCQDIHLFTQMVQAKTTLSESNKNWMKTEENNKALQYENIVNKLLSIINEVTYLLQNKNCNFMSCVQSAPSM